MMLAQSFAPIVGGEERVVEDLSRELVARGHDVSIATLQQPGDLAPAEVAGARVHALRSTSYRVTHGHQDTERRHAPPAPDPETVLDLRRVLRRERPQIVHAHNWIVHSYLPLAREAQSALVLSLHDYGLICATKRLRRKDHVCSGPAPVKCQLCAGEHYGVTKGLVAAFGVRSSESRLRRNVDVFLPVSSTVEDLCRIREDEVSRVIPNFIGELPAPMPDDPRLAQLPDGPFILFFGDATVDKGAWHLAEAYRKLSQPPPLVLVGRCYIEELRNRPGVFPTGAWPHRLAIEALRRSLFTVAPSLWPEPFGLVALEAAAAGKPIVASDIGGLRDIVVDGETGILVPPDDRPALVDGLTRLVGDAELRERMGVAASERAATFGAGAIVPRFEAAYELAIAKRRARDGLARV
ncbi:MAG TPA: glycosyltransferase family 4 protein [Solirubrobacterales bacterium]|jgi:glycosyltransferase involved in cell wall biosynthesis|nr:glycosyltransferase family 4 protein [Solirubrobacterales bacterium]